MTASGKYTKAGEENCEDRWKKLDKGLKILLDVYDMKADDGEMETGED